MLTQEPTLSVAGTQPTRILPAVSWGAIFAGTLVAVGVWMLLHVLGIGAGLTSLDPNNTDSLRRAGIGTGVWSIIAPILALFVGGLVVGKLAGPLSRMTGAIHGVVVWSLSTVASMALVWTAATAIIGGAASTGAQMASGAGGMMGGMAGGMAGGGGGGGGETTLAALGLSANDMLGPVNQRLQAAGKPTITADQLTRAAQDALRTSLREGRLDRDVLVTSLANNTPLSPEDAAAIAGSIQGRYDDRIAALRQQAMQAAETTGKALLGLFFGMLLGLGAAVGGASLSVVREQKRALQSGTHTRLPPDPRIIPAH